MVLVMKYFLVDYVQSIVSIQDDCLEYLLINFQISPENFLKEINNDAMHHNLTN